MLDYDACNAALNFAFFARKRYSGRQLFLQLSDKVAAEVAHTLGVNTKKVELEICRSVGERLAHKSAPYKKFSEKWRLWERGIGSDFPPITALLFALAHAATLMGNDGDFGSSNYYDRLGRALGYPAQELRLKGKDTEPFWIGFNKWLSAHNGEYGKPTAHPFNSWKYVNYAQSQAIIRAGELSNFHEVFKAFNLSPQKIKDPLELVPYIEKLLLKSTVNSRLKRAWAQKVLRKRYCEIVLSELESWSEQHNTISPEQERALKSFPPLKISVAIERTLLGQSSKLFLGTDDLDRLEKLGDPRIQMNNNNGYAFTRHNFGSFAELNPDPISEASILNSGLKIKSNDDKIVRLWEARPAIPLKSSLYTPSLWVETNRFPDNEPAALLFRSSNSNANSLAAKIGSLTGIQPTIISDSVNLPQGWQILINIQLRANMGKLPVELTFLGPIPRSENSIEMLGGMRLDDRNWHVLIPPDMQVNLPDGPAKVQIVQLTPKIEAYNPERFTTTKRFPGSFLSKFGVSKFEIRLSEDTLSAEAARTTKEGTTSYHFSLLDATSPRKLNHNRFHNLKYYNQLCPSLLETSAPVEPVRVTKSFTLASKDEEETCAKSGHYWHCDPHEKGMSEKIAKEQRCIRCHRVEIHKNRGKRIQSNTSSASKASPVKPLKSDVSTVFDALCYLGSGSHSDMDRLLTGYNVDFFEGHRILETLFYLGHILIEYRQGSQSVQGWRMRAPTLEFISTSKAVLKGFQNQTLISSLQSAAEKAGGYLSRRVNDEAFPLKSVYIENVSFADLEAAVSNIFDYHGRKIQVIHNPTDILKEQIHQALPIVNLAQPISLPFKSIEKVFDITTRSWTKISDGYIPKTGDAFRTRLPHARYCFQADQDRVYAAMPSIVKMVAMLSHDKSIGRYDATESTYTSPVGLEPPGLLSRLLCLKANKKPRLSDDKTSITYTKVDPIVGEFISMVTHERFYS